MKQLLNKFKVAITIENSPKKKISSCRVCDCTLFPDEILCPDCLTYVED